MAGNKKNSPKKNPTKRGSIADFEFDKKNTSEVDLLQSLDPEIETIEGETNPITLLPFDKTPEWAADNKFITHGYRPTTHSILACYESWFYLHNETINIFSHLIPSIFAIFILVSLDSAFSVQYPKADYGDHLILRIFFITAVLCFGISATYHTLICHSKKIEAVWLRLDFVGIIVLTTGIFLSSIIFSFKCHPTEQRIYCSMISTLAILSITILVSPKFQGIKWRTFRTLTFVGTGFSGVLPLGHGVMIFGFSDTFFHRGMAYYLCEGVIFLLGAFVYITRIPESIAPGRFNFFGSSHQIFHTLVVLATVVHLFGLLKVFDFTYSRPCLA